MFFLQHSDRTAFADLLNDSEITSNPDTRELLHSIHSPASSKKYAVAVQKTTAAPQRAPQETKAAAITQKYEKVSRKKVEPIKKRRSPGLFQPCGNRIISA